MIKITLKNDRSKGKIQDCINKAMWLIDDSGRVPHSVVTPFEVYVETIVRQLVEIKHIDTKLRTIIIDRGDIDTKRRLVRIAMYRLHGYKQHTYAWFVRALDVQARRYLQDNPLSSFTVAFFANVQPDAFGERRSITVLGESLHLRSWNWLEGHLEIDPFMEKMRVKCFDVEHVRNFVPLTMTVTNKRDASDAAYSAVEHYDYFRTLVNYVACYRRFYFATQPRPLGILLPSPFCPAFDSAGKYATYIFTNERYDYPIEALRQEHVERAIKLTELLRSPSNKRDTMDLLLAVIQRYGNGVDTANPQMAYLAMWQVLEAVALQHKTEDVKDRVALIFGQDDVVMSLLEIVAEVRNSFVHSGRFSPGGLTRTHFIKEAAEDILGFLFSKLSALPTRSALKKFYLKKRDSQK